MKRYNGLTGAFIDTFISAGSGGIDQMNNIAIGPDGNLYIGGAGVFRTNNVNRYDGKTGAFIDTFVQSGSGGLDNPSDLKFGPDGNLYVSAFSSQQVNIYNGTTGAFIRTLASGFGAQGIIFGPDGLLYVTNPVPFSVLRFNINTGMSVDIFASIPSLVSSTPLGICFGPDGDIYVSDYYEHSVKRFSGVTGAFLGDFIPAGSGGLSYPDGIGFGPDGNLYVSSLGSNQVKRYNGRTGDFVDNFASGGGLTSPTYFIFRDTPPGNLVVTISSPMSGAVYTLNQAVAANYTITDSGSGLASVNATVPNGNNIDTASVGAKTFSVSATDNAGNTATQSVSYTVAYAICPLYDQTRAVKSGSTIPIKLRLCDANNANVSSLNTVVAAVSVTQVSTNAPGVLEDAGNANPDDNFRYDASLGGYIFNLKTTGYATGTYNLNFTAGNDPTLHTVQFQVK